MMVERLGPGRAVLPPGAAGAGTGKTVRASTAPTAFHQILEEARRENGVIFSAHALGRLEQRKIEFGREDLQKISRAMDRIAAKGARSPLLLYNNVALLASVPNRTIITAVDGAMEKEQLYTNIDSAVILE